MRTVHEVSELAGISVRALQHYDNIGLLRPAQRTDAGYRLYSDDDLARLQQILLFRELQFPLKEIKRILESPGYDRRRALEQQVQLLQLKRDRIDRLIGLANDTLKKGEPTMSFDAFDTTAIDEYAKQAKATWGDTPEWRDYEERSAGRTPGQNAALGTELLELFKPFGQMAAAGADPDGPEAQAQTRVVQDFISEHYYACSDEVFAQLGATYGAGGEFTANINAIAGPGVAEFASAAIAARA